MKTLLFISVALAWTCTNAFAQQQRSKNSLEGMPWNERVYFGGGGSFGGSTDINGYRYTYIAVNPLVGYRITVPFSMGATINYVNINYPDVKVNRSQYGISPYAQYRIGKIFGYAEYSWISVPSFDGVTRQTYTRLPVGLGFTQPIGPKAALNVIALYDLKHARNYMYFSQPFIFRVFITAGGISM